MEIVPWLVRYGMGDAPEPEQGNVYLERLENIYKLAASLKEAEEAHKPRWEQLALKKQLYEALDP